MKEILVLIFTGLFVGVMSGYLGIGGGVIIVPILVSILGYSQQTAQGTSLAILLPPISIMAVINYYDAGYVDIKATIIMIITFMIGSYFSSKSAVTLDTSYLKKGFAIFLIIYALYILFIDK
ncbi:MAG TPA: sulfite exporter TauE/SafE family protein [Candidatus Kapabacteria bacterium]|nr:sulfite exporter TauE/SafE family protein [Candidatus Kapabacteria bacterium]